MSESDIKIVLLGQSGVGKTCLVGQFVMGKFDPAFSPTLGASYATKTMEVDSETISLQIWDTAGQERFRVLAPMYYHGAQAAIIVYSVADAPTFQEVDFWVQSLKDNIKGIELFLVANKIDLEERSVSENEGKEKADAIEATYFETSAKLGYGINDLFLTLCKKVKETRRNQEEQTTPINIGQRESKPKKSCGC